MSLEYRKSLVESREKLHGFREIVENFPPYLDEIRARVAALKIYPIKTLSAFPDMNFSVGKDGLTSEGGFKDRMAMIVQRKPGKCDEGAFDYVRFSQRTAPQFSQIYTAATTDSTMDYEAPDFETFTLNVSDLAPKGGETVVTRIFDNGELAAGVLENGPVTEWIRRFLSKFPGRGTLDLNDVHVVVQTSDFERKVEELHRRGIDSRILYSDGGQILVTSQSTLDWLNDGLQREYGDHREILMNAFRPNIVLDKVPACASSVNELPANIEDLIDTAEFKPGHLNESAQKEVDGVRMKFGKMCTRCAVPNIDPKTAKVTAEPGKWLIGNRPRRPDTPKATFGVNAEFKVGEEKNVIADGDSFIITGEKTSL